MLDDYLVVKTGVTSKGRKRSTQVEARLGRGDMESGERLLELVTPTPNSPMSAGCDGQSVKGRVGVCVSASFIGRVRGAPCSKQMWPSDESGRQVTSPVTIGSAK